MLIEFFKSCTPVLQEEIEDYCNILREISQIADPFIGFMPAIIEDIWPIYALECTKASQFNHHTGNSFYIIPYGAHDFWGVHGLNETMHNWYENDEITIGEDYNVEIEETILLNCPEIQTDKSLDGSFRKSNAVYLKISTTDNKIIHAIILIDTPDAVWTNAVEKFNIPIDIFIDSHKGMGDWFENVPLYKIIKATANDHLLPPYYFKGKYISHNAPEGFEKVYIFPGTEEKHWCENAIYKTKWK